MGFNNYEKFDNYDNVVEEETTIVKTLDDFQWVSDVSPEVLYYNIAYHTKNHFNVKELPEQYDRLIKRLVYSSVKKTNKCKKDDNKSKSDENCIMTYEEFVKVVNIGGKLVVVGYNDAGQCYFIIYVDEETGETKTINCGSYNYNYMDVIEYEFGNPSLCEHIKDDVKICTHKDKGYCHACEKYDPNEYLFQELLKLGILDRRGKVTEKYKDILQERV